MTSQILGFRKWILSNYKFERTVWPDFGLKWADSEFGRARLGPVRPRGICTFVWVNVLKLTLVSYRTSVPWGRRLVFNILPKRVEPLRAD